MTFPVLGISCTRSIISGGGWDNANDPVVANPKRAVPVVFILLEAAFPEVLINTSIYNTGSPHQHLRSSGELRDNSIECQTTSGFNDAAQGPTKSVVANLI